MSFTLWERLLRDRCLKPYRITPIHWLMARRRAWRTHVVSLYRRTRHLLLRFLCLHEVAMLPFCCDFLAQYYVFRTRILRLHLHCTPFATAYSGTLFSSRSTAMRTDPHSKCVKCLGFSHARDAVYGISKCKFCENLRLLTLGLRCVKRSHPFFPVALRRPPRPLVNPRPGVRMLSSRRWRVSRQASPFLSLPRIHRLNSRMTIFILARGRVTPFHSG